MTTVRLDRTGWAPPPERPPGVPRNLNGLSIGEWQEMKARIDYRALPLWERLAQRPPKGLQWWARL